MIKKVFKHIVFKLRNKVKIDKSNSLQINDNSKVIDCFISIRGTNNKLTIGKNTKIRNSTFELNGENCSITIADNCVIGNDCYFVVKDSNISIIIGNGCMLSRNVKIMASDGHAIFNLDHEVVNYSKNIIIEDQVWLADNVTILKGVSIGKESIVGINSTLSKSISTNCVAVGNPAKVVKKGVYWKN